MRNCWRAGACGAGAGPTGTNTSHGGGNCAAAAAAAAAGAIARAAARRSTSESLSDGLHGAGARRFKNRAPKGAAQIETIDAAEANPLSHVSRTIHGSCACQHLPPTRDHARCLAAQGLTETRCIRHFARQRPCPTRKPYVESQSKHLEHDANENTFQNRHQARLQLDKQTTRVSDMLDGRNLTVIEAPRRS